MKILTQWGDKVREEIYKRVRNTEHAYKSTVWRIEKIDWDLESDSGDYENNCLQECDTV
jgi:hypothetical protein